MTPEVEFLTARTGASSAGLPFRVGLDTPGADLLLAPPRAIYLAYTRDGRLHYVGKVDRRTRHAVAARLREHTRASLRKRTAWRWLWVVPIASTIAGDDLVKLERMLIRVYRPPGNVQHNREAET